LALVFYGNSEAKGLVGVQSHKGTDVAEPELISNLVQCSMYLLTKDTPAVWCPWKYQIGDVVMAEREATMPWERGIVANLGARHKTFTVAFTPTAIHGRLESNGGRVTGVPGHRMRILAPDSDSVNDTEAATLTTRHQFMQAAVAWAATNCTLVATRRLGEARTGHARSRARARAQIGRARSSASPPARSPKSLSTPGTTSTATRVHHQATPAPQVLASQLVTPQLAAPSLGQ
jgi:hypothetical protein